MAERYQCFRPGGAFMARLLSQMVGTRVTTEEFGRLSQAAQALGLTRAQLLRLLVRDSLAGRLQPAEPPEPLTKAAP
jgi:hypothetical protein